MVFYNLGGRGSLGLLHLSDCWGIEYPQYAKPFPYGNAKPEGGRNLLGVVASSGAWNAHFSLPITGILLPAPSIWARYDMESERQIGLHYERLARFGVCQSFYVTSNSFWSVLTYLL